MEQLDQFIGYLFTIEENNAPLTADQFDKLKSIQTKVTELVTKVHSPSNHQSHSAHQTKHQVAQPQMQLQMAENKVHRFSTYVELSEKTKSNVR